MSDQDVQSEYVEFVDDALSQWGAWITEARIDNLYYAGDSWDSKEKNKLEREGRTILELNKTKRVVNIIDGIQRDNQLSVIVSPVEGSDEETAKQLSELMLYVYDKGNAHFYTSQAFVDMLKVGIGLVGIYMDFTKDRVHGDIRFYNRQYSSFLLDPSFQRFDLSDCAAVATRDFVSPEQASMLLPNMDFKELEAVPRGIIDGRFKFTSFGSLDGVGKAKDLIAYDQFWKRTSTRKKMVVDKTTGTMSELPPKGEDRDRIEFVAGNTDKIDIVSMSIPTVELTVMTGAQVVYRGPDPTGVDEYPFVIPIGFYEPQIDSFALKLQGVVRGMRDAQKEYNKRHCKILDIMDSMVNSGWVHTEDALKNHKDLLQSGQAKIVTLRRGKQFGVDLVPIPPPIIPPGQLEYQQVLDTLITELGGLNESLLGTDEGGNTQISGRLAQVRAANGIKANRNMFDHYEFSLKLLGERVLQAIQANFGEGKVQRILGEAPTEEFEKNKDFGRYDAQIKQAVLSQSQQDAHYFELVNLKREQIVDIPEDVIVENMPSHIKGDLLERIQQQQQAAQEQAKVEFEDKRRLNRLVESETQLKIAQAVERISRSESDRGLALERISESQQNQSKAVLDMVKAIGEMRKGDLDDIEKAINIRRLIESEQQKDFISNKVDVKQDIGKINQALQVEAERLGPEQSQAEQLPGQ